MNESKKDKLTAGLLALFVGYLGVHRFYLGQAGLGIIYIVLLFFTCGISGIVSTIDGIMILTMSDADFDKKYNQEFFYSGGNMMNQPVNLQATTNAAEEIEKLDQLFQRGVITFEEFEERKARVLRK